MRNSNLFIFGQISNLKLKIQNLKTDLSNTDYKTLKYLEGFLSETEFEEAKNIRQINREKINVLEEEIQTLQKQIESEG